jgi:hypothetical protein
MPGDDLRAAADEIRRCYDRCTEAILNGDPDGFVASFGPAGRSDTAEGVAITIAETYAYIAWRMNRTIAAHSFVVGFDSVEGSADEVTVEFTEDSSATVLDAEGRPVVRASHSVNRVLWRREDGDWNMVGGIELENVRTVDGVGIGPEEDPVGVHAYRARDPA